MKTIYLIGGTMGVGKTTVSQQLKKVLPNSVFLDGDWCWDADPFQVTEETKAMVMRNICFLLNSFLHCTAYKTSGNIAVSISGNSMTLATNSPITEEKTLAINKNVPTVSGNSVLVAFGDANKQDVIVGLAAPDPVPSVFKLKTSAGHLKIVKTADDGNISGIEFTVTGDNYNKTAKSDDKGELILAGLVPGTYTVTEAPSDKYVKQEPKTVTVENGKTAEVKFHNTLNTGDCDIIKTSEDGIVSDIEFTISGDNYTKTAKTDASGKIHLSGLRPGTYTVTETPSDRYVTQEPKTVTVENNKTATVTFHNTLKKGTITIFKTGDIFSSVTEEEVTEPVEETTVPIENTTVNVDETSTPTRNSKRPRDTSSTPRLMSLKSKRMVRSSRLR